MARRFQLDLAFGVSLPKFAPKSVALVLVLLASPVALAAEQRLGEHLYLVRDKPGTPTSFHMIVGAGCTDEAGGVCRGIAHYLEHLLLVGRNPDHKEIAIRLFPDASSNGWTSQRATVYLHTIPSREDGPRADLEKLFGFYAARLKQFTISDEDAERERSVVRQEHDWRLASRPFARLARKLDRILLPDHPSGQQVIGTSEDIAQFKVEDARAFHRAWYVINNVDFVVMADIEPAALKDIADRALAGLEPRTLPPRMFSRQPAIDNGRTDLTEQDATVSRAGVYYKKLVRIDERDIYATTAARTLLAGFLTSRLPDSPYDVLVDRGKLAGSPPSVSLARVAPRSYMLTIGADVAQDVAPAALLAGIADYVERPPAITADILQRLKTRFADGRAAADKDPRQVYNRLVGWLAGRNRYEQFTTGPRRVAEATPDQVAALLAALAAPGRIATGTLTPATDTRQ
jgi:predicted Zn-dependent peptidase